MDLLLKKLNCFYEKLDLHLQSSKRDCGVCGECCKVTSVLRVYPLEMENIRRLVKNGVKMKRFRDFTGNQVVDIWGGPSGHCPFQEGDLCGIYAFRPYQCRVYGHFDYQGRSLPGRCVYRGHATRYTRREELPLYDEFNRLTKGYGEAAQPDDPNTNPPPG
jgi:Fe-S-cluster containining protein